MPDKNSLNDQITDSIATMQKLMKDNQESDVMAIAYQIMAHATGLAMLNAVNQQQQIYILQNAVTAATAKVALDSNPEDAIKIINEALKNNNIVDTFSGLKNFMDDLTKTYNDLKKANTSADRKEGSEKQTKTRTKKKSEPKKNAGAK